MSFEGSETKFWEPEEFLRLLNRDLFDNEHAGRVKLTCELDLFVEGACSFGVTRPDIAPEFIALLKGRFDKQKPKQVTMFATCCGGYHDKTQKDIERAFPEITFNFPPVSDLYTLLFSGDHHRDKARALVEELCLFGPLTVV